MNTEIVTIRPGSIDDAAVSRAADIIKSGGLVAFPTETVYGLGADATNAEAARSIFVAKGRPQDNPLIIHIHEPKEAERYTFTSKLYYKIAEEFMPGPITVILPSRESIPMATRGGLDTVAVRCPENPVARALIKASGVPIAAPSANLSGSPSPTSAKHVIDDMMGRCSMIIDGGECDFGLESTIVKIEDDTSVTLLRPGKITVGDLEAVGIHVKIADAVLDQLKDNEVALSPGMKYKHYAPSADVVLLDSPAALISAGYIKGFAAQNIAILAYDEDVELYRGILPYAEVYRFGRSDDQLSQARSLFALLREADERGFDYIFAPLPSTDGVSLAIYNRMIRAAAHKIIRL